MAAISKQERCVALRRGGLTIEEIMRELRASRADVLAWLAGRQAQQGDQSADEG